MAHREELDRKENQSLKPIVRKLKSIKDAVDEGSKKYGESPVLPTPAVRLVMPLKWARRILSYLSFPGICSLPWYASEVPQNPGVSCHRCERLLQVVGIISISCHAGIPPISWADTIVLGAKVSAEQSWVVAKKARLGAGADIDTISSAFGADFPLNLGRTDTTQPDPAGRFPDASTASPEEIQVSPGHCNASQDPADAWHPGKVQHALWDTVLMKNITVKCEACVPTRCPYLCLQLQTFLSTLGTAAGSSGGLFAPKPLFWERPAFVIWTAAQPEPAKAEQAWADANNAYKGLKLKYDRSRDTVTRTGETLFKVAVACLSALLYITLTCPPNERMISKGSFLSCRL